MKTLEIVFNALVIVADLALIIYIARRWKR